MTQPLGARQPSLATQWSLPPLFAMNFSGRVAGTKRCELCYTTTHTERDCTQGGSSDPDLRDRLRNLESAILAIAKPSAARPQSSAPRASDEPYRKWNTSGCTYPRCRFLHACSSCRGDHPLTRCNSRQGKQPIAPSADHTETQLVIVQWSV